MILEEKQNNNIFRKMVFFANWKIYMKSRLEVQKYVEVINNELNGFNTDILEVHIMTDFLSFEYVKKNLKDKNIKVGVQDLFWEDYGSFAGEVSPLMLKDLGCDSAYIGHSERKLYFGETDENINKKIIACLRNNITPMFFIGETKEELMQGKTEEVLKRQLAIGLKDINPKFIEKIIFIYEPRWAIGQKDSASPDLIREMHLKTRQLIDELYNEVYVRNEKTGNEIIGNEITRNEITGNKSAGIKSAVRVLYGGSVNLENLNQIISIDQVDGVGAARAAIESKNFIKFIKEIENIGFLRAR